MRSFLAALALAGALTPAHAHDSWISRGGFRSPASAANPGEWCCGDGDCFVIPNNKVTPAFSGYRVQWDAVAATKDNGGIADKGGIEIVPYPEAMPSPDGQFWRCKRPDGKRRCFFAPPLTD